MRRERKLSGSELSLTRRTMFLAAAVAGAVTWGASQAQATNGTWAIDASGNWSDVTKWVTPPTGIVAGGIDAVASFDAVDITALRTVTLDTAVTVGTLNLGDLTNNNNNWVFVPAGTNTLTLQTTDPAFPVISVITGRTGTISAFLAGNQGFHKTGPGTLVIGNTASASAGGTISGTVSIDAGILQINNPATLGTVSAINLSNTSSLYLRSDIPTTWTQGINVNDGTNPTINADRFTAAGNGTTQTVSGTLAFVGSSATAVTFSSGNNQILAFSKPVALPSAVNFTVNSGGFATLAQLTGPGSFTKLGAGTLTIGATTGTLSSTITSPVNVVTGTLLVNTPTALSSVPTFNLSGTMNGTAVASTGTLALRSDLPATWTQNINILDGTNPVINADRMSNLGGNAGTFQTVSGTLAFSGSSATAVTFSSGNGQILAFSQPVALPNAVNLTVSGGTALLNQLTDSGAGIGTFTKLGGGTLLMGATSGTVTGSTITTAPTVAAGILALDTNASLGSITNINLSGTGTLSLRNDTSSTWNSSMNLNVLNGTPALDANRISGATTTNTTQTYAGTITMVGTANTMGFSSTNGQILFVSAPFSLPSLISLSSTAGNPVLSSLTGPGTFVKTGAGTLSIGSFGATMGTFTPSTITGTASITAGTLALDTNNALPNITAYNLSGTGILSLRNDTSSTWSSANINVIGGTPALDANRITGATTTNTTQTFAGTITLVGTANSMGFGSTNNQILFVSNALSLPALPGLVTLTSSGGVAILSSLTGPGTFTKAGGGTIAIGATTSAFTSSTITGTASVSAGILALNSNNALPGITAYNLTGGTLSLRNDTSSSWIANINVLGGNPTINADRISSTNTTYAVTGSTQTVTGTVSLGTATAMGFSSGSSQILSIVNPLNLPSGAISLSASSGITQLSALTGAGNLIKAGAGVLAVGDPTNVLRSTISGTASVTAGTLLVSTSAALGSVSSVTVANVASASFGLLNLNNGTPWIQAATFPTLNLSATSSSFALVSDRSATFYQNLPINSNITINTSRYSAVSNPANNKAYGVNQFLTLGGLTTIGSNTLTFTSFLLGSTSSLANDSLILASPINLTGNAVFNVSTNVYMGSLSGPGTYTKTWNGTGGSNTIGALVLMGANSLATPFVSNVGTTVLDWRANKTQAFTSYTVSSGSDNAHAGSLVIYPQSLPNGTTIKLSGTTNGTKATLSLGDGFRYNDYSAVNLRVEGTVNSFNTGPSFATQRLGNWRGNPFWGRTTNFGALTLGTTSGYAGGIGLTLAGNGGIYFTGTTLEGNATINGNVGSSTNVSSVVDLGTLNAAGKTLTLAGTPGRYQISTPNAWQNVASVLAQAPVAVTAANAKLAAVDFTNASSALYLFADQDTTAGATLPGTVINSTLALFTNVGSHYNGLQLANNATITNGLGSTLTTGSVGSAGVPATVAAPLTYASNLVLNGAVNVNGGAGLTLSGNLTGNTGSLVVKSGMVILSGNNSNLGGDATTYDGVVLSGGNVRIANALAFPNFGGLTDYLEIKTAGNAVGLAYDPAVAGGIPTSIIAPTLTTTGQAVFAIDTTAWTTNINPTVVNASVPCTTNFRVGSTSSGKTTGSIAPMTGSYYLGGGGGTLELAMQNVLTGANNVDLGANGTIKLSNANNTTGTITLAATGNLVLAHTNAIQNATLALSLSSIDTKGQVASTSGALLVDPTVGNVTGNITRNGGPIGFTADKTLSSYSDLPGAWGTTVVSAVANSSGTPTDVINFGGGAAGTTTFNFAAGDHGSNPVAFYLNAPNATVKFTQANTFSGGTVLAAGTLEIGAANQLPGNLVFGGNTSTPARIHATQTMTLNNPIDAVAAYQSQMYGPGAGGVDSRFQVDANKTLTLTGTVTPDAFGNPSFTATYGLYKEGPGTLVYSPANTIPSNSINTNNASFIVADGILETAALPYAYMPGTWYNNGWGPGISFAPNGGTATFRFTGTASTGWHPGNTTVSATNSGFSSSMTVGSGTGIVDVVDPAGVVRIYANAGPAINMQDGATLIKTGLGTLSLNARQAGQWDTIFPLISATVNVRQGTMAFNDIPIPFTSDINNNNPLMNPDAQITYKVQNGAALQVYRYSPDVTFNLAPLAPVMVAGNFVLNDEYNFQGGGTPEAKAAGIYLTYTGATTINGTWRVVTGSSSLAPTAEADTVWERRAGAVVTLGTGANLIIDAAATFEANGTADLFTDTTTPTRHLPLTNNGTLNITWGNKAPAGINGTGLLVVGSSSTLTADYINQGNLIIAPDSKVSIRSNGTNTSFLGTIQIAGGTLDLANNDMLIASGAAAQERLVVSHIQALAAPTGSSLINTTGVMKGSTYTALVGSTFHGQSVGADALVLKYTVAGDANFDGTITMDDYLATDAGYLMGGSFWANGDFNHDGVVNAKDYALIDFNNAILNPGSGATMEALHANWLGADYTAALADLTAAVPEPASVGILALGAIGLLARRRR